MITGTTGSDSPETEPTPRISEGKFEPKKSIRSRYSKLSSKKMPYIMADMKPFEKDSLNVDHFWTPPVSGDTPNYNIVGYNRIKKVFKIEVGNIPDDEIEDYLRKVAEKFKKATQIQPDLDCGIYNDEEYFLPTNNNKMHANYMHVIPNSHFWTDLTQIAYCVKHQLDREKHELELEKDNTSVYVGEAFDQKYFITGLKNSIEHGYKLKQIMNVKLTPYPTIYDIFESIESMIEYLESDKFDLNDFGNIINNTIGFNYKLTNGLKMERKEVYRILDGERDYQDNTWVARRTTNGTPDQEKSIAEWLTYIEHHLEKVKYAIYYLNDNEALAEIRKVTALGVRAMEIHGCPERKIGKIINPLSDIDPITGKLKKDDKCEGNGRCDC